MCMLKWLPGTQTSVCVCVLLWFLLILIYLFNHFFFFVVFWGFIHFGFSRLALFFLFGRVIMKMYKSFTALINFIFTLASRKRSKLNEIKNAFSYLATPLTVRLRLSQQVNKNPTTIYATSNWERQGMAWGKGQLVGIATISFYLLAYFN